MARSKRLTARRVAERRAAWLVEGSSDGGSSWTLELSVAPKASFADVEVSVLNLRDTSPGFLWRAWRYVNADNREQSQVRNVWNCMLARCSDSRSRHFKRYGGRGITVCARWVASFEAFRSDMGERPAGATIERRDNNGNYEPGNCVWASRKIQQNNRNSNFEVEFQGERLTLTMLAERASMNVYTLRGRLLAGMSAEQAVATPVGDHRAPRRLSRPEVEDVKARYASGEKQSVIALTLGCDNSTISRAISGRKPRTRKGVAA